VALAIRGIEMLRFLRFHLGELFPQLVEDAHDDIVHFFGVEVEGFEPSGGERRARVGTRGRHIRRGKHCSVSFDLKPSPHACGGGRIGAPSATLFANTLSRALGRAVSREGLASGRNSGDGYNMQNQRHAVNT